MRSYFLNKIYISIVLIISVSSYDSIAQYEYDSFHPELDWFSYETEHFYIHFHQGTKRTAVLAGRIAEDIYSPITELYNYIPDGKIHLIIKDTDDNSNGAAYFFDNKIEIWAENLDYIMRGTRSWLHDVVTHEFAHMISIQKSIKFSRTIPYGFFQIFGYESERRKDVVRGFPNTLVSYPIASINIPVWFAEGVAQFQAPGAKYDYRDPHREMILRDRVLYNKLLTFNEMGVFGKSGHGNESAYNMGYAFVNYLCDRFGEDVLKKITAYNAKISTFTFDKALENSTGFTADTLYLEWKRFLEKKYSEKLKNIYKNEVKGNPIEYEGFANLYPIWSPDGTKIAYVSNKNNDYFSQNSLIVYDKKTGEKKEITKSISSSISWSPDGRYIIYSRKTYTPVTRSYYNDLYIYDCDSEEETRITKQMRGKNPDWSNKGDKITYVAETNGLNQLFIFKLDEISKSKWKTYYIDSENGLLLENKEQADYVRGIEILGDNLIQVLSFEKGRQIYHPRWSPDDNKIIFDTSTDYGRDIALYDLKNKIYNIVVSGKEELRYPTFSSNDEEIYYASSETGIYNVYKKNLFSDERLLLTNVTGGAMMPDVNQNNELVYACYDSLGYHIFMISNFSPIDPNNSIYDREYISEIPDREFGDSKYPEYSIKPYSQQFTGLHILPRLLIDYKTVKPGFYLISDDVLSDMSLFAGAAVNSDYDYDLFGLFEYNDFHPRLFLEAYNSSANIKDSFNDTTSTGSISGEPIYTTINQDINFDLTEIQVGVQERLGFLDGLYGRLAYILSLYHAKIKYFDPDIKEIVHFRYQYLSGRALKFSLLLDQIKSDRFKYINPSGGRYASLRYSYEENDFLTDFDFSTGLDVEVFTRYNFHKIEFDWEDFFENPLFKDHALSLRLRGGYIDRPVDDFFYLFAGGLLGMKGYSYYSLEGTKKMIGTFTYRMPLFKHIDWQFFNIYFDKLYLGFFYDYGNAWVEDELNLSKFKRDIGIQLRLETFSNYLFPTRIFGEAVYPLDEISNRNIIYSRDWRFYFGVLFEFDIRERLGKTFSYIKQPGFLKKIF